MCCGCMKMMDKDGKASLPFAREGMIGPEALANLAQAADYPDKKSADESANSHRWVVIDGNHRCPKCSTIPEPDLPRRGAYIEIPDRPATPGQGEDEQKFQTAKIST